MAIKEKPESEHMIEALDQAFSHVRAAGRGGVTLDDAVRLFPCHSPVYAKMILDELARINLVYEQDWKPTRGERQPVWVSRIPRYEEQKALTAPETSDVV